MTKITDLTAVSTDLSLEDRIEMAMDITGSPNSPHVDIKHLLGRTRPDLAPGRLSLVSGDAAYDPRPQTPTSTDTTAETVTFTTAHGWVTGTVTHVMTTVGGLTARTKYYIRVVSSTSISFHTTFADAAANTNKVNLTASITVPVIPVGLQNSTIYYTPWGGIQNEQSIHDAIRSTAVSASAEISVTLSGLSPGVIYDVLEYQVSGVRTLFVSPAWTGFSRGTGAGTPELTNYKGILYNARDMTGGPLALKGKYLGSFYAMTATTTEDSMGFRLLWNNYNQIFRSTWRCPPADSWTYDGTTWRRAAANSNARVFIVSGYPYRAFAAATVSTWLVTSGSTYTGIALSLNSTTDRIAWSDGYTPVASGSGLMPLRTTLPPVTLIQGLNEINWMENCSGATTTFYHIFATGSGFFEQGIRGWALI